MVGAGTVEHGDVADPLHQCGFAAAGQIRDHRIAGLAIRSGHLHLDQFVMLQRSAHFGNHGIGETFGADLQHRLQAMGLAAKEPVLGVGERQGHAVGVSARGREGAWSAQRQRL